MLTPHSLRGRLRIASPFVFASVCLLALSVPAASQTPRVVVAAPEIRLSAADSAVDAGPVPVSQPLRLTLRLNPSADRTAALDQLLAAQITSSSPSYHQWLTPQQFAASYGATEDQIATATSWFQSQGLTVESVSPAKTWLVLSGTAAQVQRAFAVSLRNYAISGASYYANSDTPTMPRAVASLVAGVSGLSSIPSVATTSVSSVGVMGKATVLAVGASSADALSAAASAIDDNSSPILAISTSACSIDLTQADYDNYRALFRQASAQGITVLATSSCGARGSGSFPASLSEVTALTIAPTTATFAAIDPRPSWQSAAGLPTDGSRDEPDLTTSSLADFANAMVTILQQSGGRQGNINSTLYALAKTPDLYTQPDDAPAGTWEPATGLGTVNLQTLIKVYPRGVNGTTTTLTSSSNGSSVGYGTSVTLTATVSASTSASTGPTGTVTFSTASQGTIGTAALTNGTATLTVGNLNVGTYLITAGYSGDSNYAASSGTTSVTVTTVTATVAATISPASNVPYGSTATVTATVSLPNSGAAPSGTVSAQIEGITGALYTATLSPNPGGNTATANINVNAPTPSTTPYTVQVTCAGNQNFQCQAPQNLTFTTAKGNTTTTISLSPAAPQAGQPVTITATVNNNGNGTGTYTFSGSITFVDTSTGKTLATVPVGTNQAATSQTLSGNVQHNIVATYSGDANWKGSTSTPQAVTPTLLPATVSLTANSSKTLAGVNVVFTATVYTTVTNTVGPTGTVTFYDTFNGSVVQLGVPSAVTPNGPNQSIAIFSTTGLQAGTHSVYAIYNGDANFSSATALPYSLMLSDFTLSMVPQTLTLQPGQTGQAVILAGLVGGFNGSVSLGCTPPSSSETTCSFNPVILTGGGSTTLTIVTTAPVVQTSHRGPGHSGPFGGWNAFAGSTLAVLVWFVTPRRRRMLPGVMLLLATVCLSSSIGCGRVKSSGSGGTTITDPGTPLGTQIYTITAAGSDGVNTVRHTYQYQVTIQ
ncbi:Ig-like domain repeat protein [Edaphobacter bradus]|uniref:Ig-like domain repeat protein n=1 Tax=Edaphobacter bradus TaxID=2259016 RepID=UPI0021DF4B4A|nr:Ig-like domain repeat protein [Edaphobacter bradus]